ncbi:putative ubiquitin carboxyl-terminal hydrolase 6 [Iris pallida]|uniref:Ubiquitin carboxyl-terminal hydrolase 6 n=1 Tax=Iris pallida TaxID=29817 RepID=A0AAX6DJ36_IRIPA|nr:putative ubiquitin carboxyl-terminal hydrolase 6 [Iris pallida]
MTPLHLSRFDSDLWPPPPSSSCSSDFSRSSGRSRHILSSRAHAYPDSFSCHQRLHRRSCRYNQSQDIYMEEIDYIYSTG